MRTATSWAVSCFLQQRSLGLPACPPASQPACFPACLPACLPGRQCPNSSHPLLVTRPVPLMNPCRPLPSALQTVLPIGKWNVGVPMAKGLKRMMAKVRQ